LFAELLPEPPAVSIGIAKVSHVAATLCEAFRLLQLAEQRTGRNRMSDRPVANNNACGDAPPVGAAGEAVDISAAEDVKVSLVYGLDA
jgi:hypothetical protein